ncbi:MAG: 16S rRNA (cytosine(1402)-N(4))-methyltransferase [Deltaproteobacteria bacterium HGW-Deltaproteobacteria-23]|jgi:16S rRNA (cytosine1402-N4)-methyltransferase|nr:MAG: 16S rRNA (cytosine(1402)-N(4))-methyltransferase [Deltaproteobacteria bacterium HGW-Deltaproteobacteria-23]
MSAFTHIPVLAAEVMEYLAPVEGGIYVDGTLGGGGHAAMILDAIGTTGRLFGFDRDISAINAASQSLAVFEGSFIAVNSNFSDMEAALSHYGVSAIDGFLLDLGVSSHQLDTAGRGFSFQQDAPLDMRMDREKGQTVAELLAESTHGELAKIIRDYGEERWAGRIASFICKAREEKPLETTLQLAELIKGAIPRKAWEERIHPATRTFQAFRIAVNEELHSLEKGLAAGVKLLKPGGRGVVISFHSLEDRIVKQMFRGMATGCVCPKEFPVCVCNHKPQAKVLTGKPVMAGKKELAENSRSRSAKLRAIERL